MTLTLKVEVAFNAGYATAAGSRTWTDISAYVELNEGIDIQVGRRDEFSVAEPNTLSLTLDNSDGRFTPERSSSPYYPNVKLYRPIRVTATLPDASTSVRFLGYVTEWPTEWQGGSAGYAKSQLTASSRMSRLGSTTQLRTMLEQEVLTEQPLYYATLGDEAGSTTAAETSGAGAEPLRMVGTGTPVVFGSGIGPGTDGLTAAQIAVNGQTLRGVVQNIQNVRGIEVWAVIPTPPAIGLDLVAGVDEDARNAFSALGFMVFSDGKVGTFVQGIGSATSPSSVCDGNLHHLYAQFTSGGNVELYVDGVLAASGAATPTSTPRSGTFDVGGYQFTTTPTLAKTIAHAAVHSAEISAARVASHYSAGVNVNEASGDRAKRIAAYGGVPAAEFSGSSAVVVVGAQDTSGKTALDAIRDVESTEAGILYDAPDGTMTLASRSARYSATVAFTLDASMQHVGQDIKPTYDQTGLTNDVTVTGPGGPSSYKNATSISDHGEATASFDTLATDADEPLMLAGWQVNNFGQPRTRIPTLTVDVLPFASGTPSVMNLAAATVGTLLQANNLPTQAASTSGKFFVEGYTEHFNVESWVTTFNVSDATPYLNVFTVEDSVLGQYDAYPLAL